jgi:biopolymer transport protein ExbB/TolQ
MTEWFSLGGFPMWATLLFGVLSIGAAARYAIRPERRFVPLVVSLGSMTLLSGLFGFVTGLAKSLNALDAMPADRRWIWMLGLGESLVNVAFALALVAVATFATVVGTWKVSRA